MPKIIEYKGHCHGKTGTQANSMMCSPLLILKDHAWTMIDDRFVIVSTTIEFLMM
jgi:hypothetical protein